MASVSDLYYEGKRFHNIAIEYNDLFHVVSSYSVDILETNGVIFVVSPIGVLSTVITSFEKRKYPLTDLININGKVVSTFSKNPFSIELRSSSIEEYLRRVADVFLEFSNKSFTPNYSYRS